MSIVDRGSAPPDTGPARATADTGLVLRRLWWLLGLGLVAAGVVVGLSTRPDGSEFSWYVDTLSMGGSEWEMGWSDPVIDGTVVVVSWWQVAGYAAAMVGVAMLAAGIGFGLGRRGARPPEQG